MVWCRAVMADLSEDRKVCSNFCLVFWYAETRTGDLWKAFITWAFFNRLNNIILCKLMVFYGPVFILLWLFMLAHWFTVDNFYFFIYILNKCHYFFLYLKAWDMDILLIPSLHNTSELPFLLATVAIFQQEKCWWLGFSASRNMFYSPIVKELSEGKNQNKGTVKSLDNKPRSFQICKNVYDVLCRQHLLEGYVFSQSDFQPAYYNTWNI